MAVSRFATQNMENTYTQGLRLSKWIMFTASRETGSPPFFFFFFWILIKMSMEIAADAPAVVKNNTERFLVHLAQYPIMATFCRTLVWYDKQGKHTDVIVCVCVCVYSGLCSFSPCVGSCAHHCIQDTRQSTTRISWLAYCTTPVFPLLRFHP